MLFDARFNEAPSLRDRVLILRSHLAGMSPSEDALLLMAENSVLRRYAVGDQLYTPGQPIDKIQFLLEGAVEITRHSGIVQRLDAPGGLGWPSFLSRDEKGLNAVCVAPMRAIEIPVSSLEAVLEKSFSTLRMSLGTSARFILHSRGQLPAMAGSVHDEPLGTYPAETPTLVQRVVDIVETAGLFQKVDIDAMVSLVETAVEQRMPEGQVLWRIGDPPTFTLRVKWGRVKCRSETGEECVIGAPYSLGFFESLAGTNRVYEAEALTPLVAYRSDAEAFFNTLEEHYSLARELLAGLSTATLQLLEAGADTSFREPTRATYRGVRVGR